MCLQSCRALVVGKSRFATVSCDRVSDLLARSLLLHTERSRGEVVPVWEEVSGEDAVLSLKDIMTRKKHSHGVELQFTRIPITAERAPDPVDMSEMLEHVMRLDEGTPIVLNCQLGRGRSTMASIIVSLAQGWLAQSRAPATPGAGSGPGKRPTLNRTLTLDLTSQPQQRSYQAINSASSGLGVSM